jgi:hypothetical protein
MSARWVGISVAVVGMIVLAGGAGRAGTPRSEPFADARQRVVIPWQGQDKVLAEMRQMLGSISGILHGLISNDMAVAEKAARASGMKQAVDPQLEKKLPEPFLQLGLQTHKTFDELADQAKASATREDVLKKLAGLTNNCVACHAAYRFGQAR